MLGTLRTLLLFGVLTSLFVGVGWLIGGAFAGNPFAGMVVFLAIAAVLNLVSYFWSDKFVLWSYRARIVGPDEAPRVHRLMQKLVLRSGLPMPRVALIPTPAPNAFATGRNPKHAVVAVTEGILRILDDDELSGVLAHELAHVKNRDILIMSVAATIAGAIAMLGRSLFWGAMFGGGNREGGNIFTAIAVSIVAGLAAVLVQLAISRSREYEADRVGGEIHGNPLDLARALASLERGNARAPMQDGNPATAHMFIVNPFSGGGVMGLFMTHPPMERRIAKLREQALRFGYM